MRAFLQKATFTDDVICRALAIDDMSDLGRVAWSALDLAPYPEAFRWCLHIFIRGLSADQRESCAVCGEEVFAALLSLGLLRPSRKNASLVVCPAWLYPADGFFLASDRRDDPDGDPYKPGEDVVFPAIYAGTLRFLDLLPRGSIQDALDLCGGSGVGALHLSRSAKNPVTADITERSSFFAEFNAKLNDTRVLSLCGDLYAPVTGRTFDLISAHPPFVPAVGKNMVYRDGGETGEEITRRIIEGLPQYLKPHGTCVILCVGRDTTESRFEQRAQGWLGPNAREFDLVFGLEKVLSIDEVVDSLRKRGEQVDPALAKELDARLRALGTHQFVYGALFVRREGLSGVQEPARVQLTLDGRAEDFERILAWRRHRHQAGFSSWLSEARPKLAPELQLTVRHVVQDGQLVPAEFVFAIEKGFRAALRPDGWIVPLLARFSGQLSVRKVFERAKAESELPDGFALDDLSGLVASMVEKRFFELDFPNSKSN